MREIREAKEYLVLKGHGNRSECIDIMQKLIDQLKNLQNQHSGLAYLVRLLNDEEDVIDEMLNSDQVKSLIQDRFPILYLNVTYDSDSFDVRDLSELETHYDLKLAFREL